MLSRDARYVIYPNFLAASQPTTDDHKICLVSQYSIDKLSSLPWIIESWKGPLSIGVYTPGSHFSIFLLVYQYLRVCYPDIDSRVSFHLVAPKTDIIKIDDNLMSMPVALNCDEPNQKIKTIVNSANITLISNLDHEYPQNLFRNLGRRSCPTPFSLTIDGDIIPSLSLYQKLNSFLTNKDSCTTCAYVIPAFEVEKTHLSKVPGNIKGLFKYLEDGWARIYHIQVSVLMT